MQAHQQAKYVSRGTTGPGKLSGAAALRLRRDDLATQLRLLPLTSRLRGAIVTHIRAIEDQLDRLENP